jgi:TRAP-type C4-dicarboxylate transport system permease small subunit
VSRGGDLLTEADVAVAQHQATGGEPRGPPGLLARLVAGVNRIMVVFGMIALLVAAAILTYSVFSRYFFKAATDWQDEAAVFCIVGAVFLSGAYVQSRRGHIGIEAVASILPPAVNRARAFVVDVLSFLFCSFFAWKSWTLWHEAWVDKMTSSSSWAPPLAIPYGLMSVGMSLLALQLLLQLASHFQSGAPRQ